MFLLRNFPCFFLLLACAPLRAVSLPDIPPTDRVLTREEVKNFWLNALRAQPLPPKPTRLHMDKLRAWEARLESRKNLMAEIRGGLHDTNARLASLSHNVEAWKLLGNPAKSREAELELMALKEHLAKLETLEAQRRAAEQVVAMSNRISELQAEIDSLRSRIQQTPACP